jgi:hypothetical protein
VAVTGDRSDAAIVITTLILATIFTPARKALEGVVEARFKPLAASQIAVTKPMPVALDERDLDRRIAAIARAAVDEALADRARIEAAEKGRISRGD